MSDIIEALRKTVSAYGDPSTKIDIYEFADELRAIEKKFKKMNFLTPLTKQMAREVETALKSAVARMDKLEGHASEWTDGEPDERPGHPFGDP